MLELNRMRHMVDTASHLTTEAREESEHARDQYDEHQWTSEEKKTLNKRKQPINTNNRIKRKVDAMIGIEQRMRVDPKAFPRTPQDEETAEAATEALVFVDDNTRLDALRSHVFENVVVEGYGAVEVVVEPKRGLMEITINRIRWEELFFDPHSREKDFSDASYMGSQKWMNLDAATAYLMPIFEGSQEELEEILQTSMSNVGGGDTYEDRPIGGSGISWGEKKQRRVRVVQMYYLHNAQWHYAIFTGSGAIYNQLSPYVDEDGEPECAILGMTAYIDRDNRRYGVVKSMISDSDSINKRESKLLHQAISRQTVGLKGVVDDVADMKRELTDPNGHVELNYEAFEDAARAGQKPFEILPQNDQIAVQFQLLQESKEQIDMIGPNPALIGQTESGASGRAIMAQQQAGMAELAPLYDSLRDWNIRVYRAMWARIKQFWTEPRWVRILDAEGQMQWTGFNQPQQVGVVDMQTGQPLVQIMNQPSMMDVDIIIEDVPDHVSLQQEQFDQLAQMASNGIPIPPELIIKASSVKDKGEILQMLKEQQEREMAAQMQVVERSEQREDVKVQSQAQKDMAGAAKDAATATKTQVEAAQMAQGLR